MAQIGHNFGLVANWIIQSDFVREMLEDSKYLEKLVILTQGLDKESITTIYRVLSRLKQAVCNGQNITQLNAEEITMLNRIHTEFYPNIFEIAPNALYYYDGYYLPIPAFHESVFWYRLGLSERGGGAIFDLKALQDKDIIDVGAYIGDSALILQEYTRKKVYAFEAVKSNYQTMLQTIKLNACKRIVPINKGLGAKNSVEKISTQGAGSSIVLPNNNLFEEVEIIPLDSYVKEKKLKIGFIKVDIEGFEQEFLKGAKETIMKQKPAMLISLYHKYSDFFDIKPMIDSWNLGYKFKVVKPIDHNVSGETALYCEVR
ncbi:FkbM family methyltransferase [Helicobacter sp.]|uniref:FkbM family methyltransferase n=1 Tax=Helicobacter sp. TaxID=218 RepID=UPI0025BB00BF|nr:FkbM family methyltransferase [Helicobacter sp.]MCI5969319.1 FkbM family methyltransferase [Helicobacter sp.]MDY2585573.1 FkbM family methyltransferase [Helicobacter sp.]